ncbi:hypothetical protein FVEG_13153 [Fusarium verticillioides 7600]|uniref:Uncharacterized protein n=1 Tax=Gibberella moniliformis (strain M3125 / FGSC 7600) TaxID=334819 RepID=W7N608_GIBM7|nr:hypothetical protein FVEG_13153 [Fusarium verticillioides 7600]EWG55104.1 hypothetical protein FVEG_13153 [Fusarium verticillioides 7600]
MRSLFDSSYNNILEKHLNQAPGPLLVLPQGSGLSRVVVSQQELARYAPNSLQRAVLALPSNPVTVMDGQVRWKQILGMRNSYINAFLIQSRGTRELVPCTLCAKKMEKDRSQYARPFPYCIRLPGHFGGCCGNCKWPDHAAKCHGQEEAGAGDGSRGEPNDLADGEDDPVVVSGDDNLDVNALEDAGDFLPGEEDEMDMSVSLVPLPDDGSAGAATEDDPIRID